MTRTISETERARQQYAALVSHYRAIGPAAIMAALLCSRKKSVKSQFALKRAS
ncbi:transcriptional regulator [Mesorhizobium australicum]|uniref:Uncharacterized protein n=1 Tax=Mesorhizobium australicum TaxID=536018 RepID=A0A1X7NZT9_9HYPH|nr:transcriptional regulator [Mesorhizobium australicum]SMH43783.1 hypothetical protein SAMN02982922_2950 [Mesorhizobium australicum]